MTYAKDDLSEEAFSGFFAEAKQVMAEVDAWLLFFRRQSLMALRPSDIIAEKMSNLVDGKLSDVREQVAATVEHVTLAEHQQHHPLSGFLDINTTIIAHHASSGQHTDSRNQFARHLARRLPFRNQFVQPDFFDVQDTPLGHDERTTRQSEH